MSELTMGSLFDGIGGFPLAAIRNGITPVWASEIEPFPIEVTMTHFPDMAHVGDITKLKGAELPPVDDLRRQARRRGCPDWRNIVPDRVRVPACLWSRSAS